MERSIPNYIAFDCETTGLDTDPQALVTCTVTIAYPPVETSHAVQYWHSNFAQVMSEEDVVILIDYLYNALVVHKYKIVSYNGTGFDFYMLSRHITSSHIKELYMKKLQDLAISGTDIFLDFACEFGYYTSMQSFANGCNLEGKSGSGKDAIKEWLSRDRDRQQAILEYCKNDVLCLCRIYNYACEHGRLYRQTSSSKKMMWISRNPHIRSAGECMVQYTQKKPKVKWMKHPPDMSDKWRWIEF